MNLLVRRASQLRLQLRTTAIAAMKRKLIAFGFISLAACLLQGCVSLPPLVRVEHKDNGNNEAMAKRLDSIDHRLDQLEQKSAQN
jgi:hypothetical protein